MAPGASPKSGTDHDFRTVTRTIVVCPRFISIARLRHRYNGVTVLALDDWQVEVGEHWAVIGASGSGKTTLLHVLAGLVRPTEGEVSVAGECLDRLADTALDAFRGRTIGFVPQRLHLIASISAYENVALAQRFAGAARAPARVAEVLERLGVAAQAHALPRTLSQGQAQRVAIARAIVNRPKLLLADEPTANLDDANAERALALLAHEADACGATLVVATHDRRVKAALARQLELEAPR
jgi:putative ABC transport system ATP-binding protein